MFVFAALLIVSQQPVQPAAVGIASYYTVESSSTLTASGERFQDDQLTCAMRFGDFGDYYLIVAEDGKSVVCKLNDRGPYVDGRVIDLSKAAMSHLNLDAGLVPVKIYRLGSSPPPAASIP